ncbi:MAG: YfhO family protein [Dehalococcoidia bacterium]|nr:YfhO family protein [Dehalococcoidia bacterium]
MRSVISTSQQPKTGLAARLSAARGHLLAGLLVLAGLVFVFRGALLKGLVFQETDTLVYYYPVLTEVRRALQQGTLPLWTPYIYGGFPLFADGESGALYPINLLLLLLTSPEGTLLWLGPLRVGMAALFMYMYVRTIGLGSLGSLVSALVFAFGGFTIAQLHHLNLSSGALWLPLILLLVERAYRAKGLARAWAIVLAGVAFGLQSLALHVQVSLMTVLFLALYVAFRSWAFPIGSLLRRLGLMVGTLAGTAGLGLGLAAVQWLPLYELSRFSPRAPGLGYSQALEYALPPVNLITLLSPYFFRGPQRTSWAIWSSWETAIYVGVVPLLLAAVAVLWGRNRWTAFFAGTGLLSLLLAMANYLPLNLHYLLYRLPWFDALRAPGRFSYLFTFSLACLAGFGAPWLANRRDAARPRSFAILPLAFLGLVTIVIVMLQWLREWLIANQGSAVDLLGTFYMGLGPLEATRLNKLDIYYLLIAAADRQNWYAPAALALFSAALLLAWRWRPGWRRVWLTGLALLAAADLFWFAQDFHPTLPASKLAQASPAVSFLAGQDGGERTFNLRTTLAEPNRLVPFGVQAAGGYSSLPSQRHIQYASAAQDFQGPFIDLWNVRYLVTTRRPWGSSYNGVTFDPTLPLFDSAIQGSSLLLPYIIPDVQAQEVRIISALRQAAHIPQGTAIGSVVLTDDLGFQRRVPLLAGIHTAEAAYDREDVRSLVQHQKPAVADTIREPDSGGQTSPVNLYYASLTLPQPTTIQRLTIEYTYSRGSLEVYGLGLLRGGKRVYQIRPFQLEKYRLAYQDDDTAIYENREILPRAFLVPKAVSLPGGPAVLTRLQERDFDPLQEVLLEEPVSAPEVSSPQAPGLANIRTYEDQRVVVEVDAQQPAFLFLGDSYYPGWRAYVDGQETKVYRADYLFRAVQVPQGRHLVEFRYQPDSFVLGLWVSVATAGLLMLAVLGAVCLARWLPRE